MAIEEGKTKAIVLANPLGNPVDSESIREIADEYGIFFMQVGLNPQDFNKIKVVPYYSSMVETGVVRCNICFNNFRSNDRLK